MIVYTCPKCGGHLQFSTIATYPPIHVTECFSCGWREEKRDEIEKIPYKTTTAASDVAWLNDDEYLSKDELYTKADMVAILTELRQEIDIMSDTVVEGRTVTITSWSGMKKRICKLIQSKIDKLKENI